MSRERVVVDPTAFEGDLAADVERLEALDFEVAVEWPPVQPSHRADVVGLLLGNARVDATVLARVPGLKVISRYGTGVDNIDSFACQARNVAIKNVDDYATETVATHALALTLAGVRRLHDFDSALRRGQWGHTRNGGLRDLSTLRVGVVGLGRIGGRYAEFMRPLVQQLEAYDPYRPDPWPPAIHRATSLGAMLFVSDIVSLHVPLTEETRGMLDVHAVQHLPDDSIVVNTSRGAVVDIDAIDRALRDDRLGAAGLDVFPDEPLEEDANILTAPRAVLTPHVAWYSKESEQRMRNRALQNLVEAIRS